MNHFLYPRMLREALTILYNCLSLILNLGMLELVEKDVCFSSKAR